MAISKLYDTGTDVKNHKPDTRKDEKRQDLALLVTAIKTEPKSVTFSGKAALKLMCATAVVWCEGATA